MYLRSSWTREFRASLKQEQFTAEEFLRLIQLFRAEYASAAERRREWSWFLLGGVIDQICNGPNFRATAMHERHFSLERMCHDDRMGGWRFHALSPECTVSDEAVALAAATAPLHWDSTMVAFVFSPDEFFEILLRDFPASLTP